MPYDDIERLKFIGWGLEGDNTLNAGDRLDRKAAAKEERETLALEVRQEKARNYGCTRYVEDDLFPGRCALCDVRRADHGWVVA